MSQPASPPPPVPSTTGQWSGPCLNCKCARPIPVNEKSLASPAGPAPFTQCCLTLATDKVEIEELCGHSTDNTTTTASSEEETLNDPESPKKAVNTAPQPLNRPGSNLTVFHKHPGYNETKQVTDRSKPLVNSILTCYQSTLSGVTTTRAIKSVANDGTKATCDDSLHTSKSFITSMKLQSSPTSVRPKSSPAYVKPRSYSTYDQPWSKSAYDRTRLVLPSDGQRELPSFPNCFTHLNPHPRCTFTTVKVGCAACEGLS